MKKNIFKLSFLILMLFFFSCKKDSNVFVPNNGEQLDSAWSSNITSSNQVLILSKNLESSFTAQLLTSAADTIVSPSTGFQIIFPSGSFLLNGVAITQNIKVEYKLIQNKGDFINYGIPTVSNRIPLESGGALFIRITSNGQPVTLKANKKIVIRYTDTNLKQGMQVYYGNELTVTNSLNYNWVLATDSSNVKLWEYTNVTPALKGYIVETFKQGWVNVDKVLETGQPKVEIKAVLPDLFSNANTAVYMVFKSYRTVVQLSGNLSTRTFIAANIPVNQGVKMISISKVGSSYYLGVKDEITATNMVSFIKPELSSLASIQAYLKTL
jgi:hypothetical protein